MSYFNQVMLIGHLGDDPVVLKQDETRCFVRLSLACNQRYTDAKGKSIQDVQWHAIYLNNNLAKFALAHYKKGIELLVVGELRTSERVNKDGKTFSSTVIYANACKPFAKVTGKDQTIEPSK